MKDDFKDILSNLNNEIDQELLSLYLQDKLSKEDRYAFESSMVEDDFAADALEGLSSLPSNANLDLLQHSLRNDLNKRLKEKNKSKLKATLQNTNWYIYAIVLVILLCMVGYYVVTKVLQQ